VGEGYRPSAGQALAAIVEGQMAAAVDGYLDELDADDRNTGADALRRPILGALGLRRIGKKAIIDFRVAASKSAAE
jgi:hypothetical protein